MLYEVITHLYKSIDDLELSVRATNCLRGANIALVGELVQRSEGEMLKTKNFGRKSVITSYSIHYTKLYDPLQGHLRCHQS